VRWKLPGVKARAHPHPRAFSAPTATCPSRPMRATVRACWAVCWGQVCSRVAKVVVLPRWLSDLERVRHEVELSPQRIPLLLERCHHGRARVLILTASPRCFSCGACIERRG
jgi:hypothetical protein